MKLVHLTDTHLLPNSQTLFGINAADRLKAAIISINRDHSDADFCIITGDITHLGQPEAFKLFEKIINMLNIPYQLIPGNHDHRKTLLNNLRNIEVDENRFIQYVINYNNNCLLFLDTLDEGKASGLLCEKRLHWLKKSLDRASQLNSNVYIFMHHAPMNVGIKALDKIKLANGGEFKFLIQSHKNIQHLFFGHLHRACHGSWAGISFSTVKSTAHQTSLNLKTEQLKVSIGESPSYAVVLIANDSVIVHDHCFLNEDQIIEYQKGIPDRPPEILNR